MNPIDLETRIRTAPPLGANTPQPARRSASMGPSFGQVLSERLTSAAEPLAVTAARANVKFSGHAQTRLASRRITLSGDDVARLGSAMTQAAAKGAKDSLMLMDKTAFVVSVANRTVITAVAQDALKENIFTNIDSAMIL
jgi:flagellar operon protein